MPERSMYVTGQKPRPRRRREIRDLIARLQILVPSTWTIRQETNRRNSPHESDRMARHCSQRQTESLSISQSIRRLHIKFLELARI